MEPRFSFQFIILKLQDFWASHGCLIWQPYHTEVGAGTMNPATYLRVLGPEPWNVAYVEPSIRPDDGRYGENPNRLQEFYQYQVILKPDPGNPQELYLESLQALGLDLRQHDIRFVEDNWEQPALGAWGLGWEVWLDGQEITQFTYFQQSGGFMLDPVSVEITYGLERIAMALQGVHGFRDIHWNEFYSYGDVRFQAEQEHSTYVIEVADVNDLRQAYDIYRHEAEVCLERDLVLPALDYILKCSHAFNILDTRGAVGVTDRQAVFGVTRELARRVSEAYLAQREKLGYPWLQRGASVNRQAVAKPAPAVKSHPASPDYQPFLLEIGTEELPHSDLEGALAQLGERLPALLSELRLAWRGDGPEALRILGTTRRLVVYIPELAAWQADLEQAVKGPPANRAFDEHGKPTKAAEGFASSKGVAVGDLQVRAMDGGSYVVAVVRQAGRPALAVLSEALPDLLASLRFGKSMRWNHTNVAFSRPIRWLLALYGEQVVPFEYAGLQSTNLTRGLRLHTSEEIVIQRPQEYFSALQAQGIVLDVQERQRRIWSLMEEAAVNIQGKVPEDAQLLAQVASEVEMPTALLGSFDPAFLELPHEVLIAVMKKHQKYFPVEYKNVKGKPSPLQPNFIALRNGDGQGLDLVRQGNEDVIRARFADAAFFIAEDKKHPLAEFVPKLGTLTFQKELGSMLDKTRRLVDLVSDLAPILQYSQEETRVTLRSAELSKAELATKMVVEMTSLQGVIGRYYAQHSGEPQEVAEAIFEQHLPRYAGEAAPRTRPGLLLGLADRLDTLAGLFSVGLAPSGAKDPFALRRAALGLVQNLVAWNLDFDLREALKLAAAHLPGNADPIRLADCLDFIRERVRNVLLEQGYRYDVVDAVLAIQGYNPAGVLRGVKELSTWVEREDWRTILPAYARCVRITRDIHEEFMVSPEVLLESAEKELYSAIKEADLVERRHGSVDDFLNAFIPMIPAINRFFDDVLVMTDDLTQRANRLGLLQMIVSMSEDEVDMSRLEGF